MENTIRYYSLKDRGRMIDKKAAHIRDYRRRLDVVSDYLSDGDRVLDFGCDHGTLKFLGAGMYKGKKLNIEGFDLPGNTEALYHDFKEIPNIYYDVILGIRVFEHIPDEKVVSTLIELRRFSNKLVIDVPNTENMFVDIWKNLDHEGPRDNPDMLAWIGAAGWTVTKIIKNDWREKDCKLVPSILRFLFNVSMQKSPFWGYMIICE